MYNKEYPHAINIQLAKNVESASLSANRPSINMLFQKFIIYSSSSRLGKYPCYNTDNYE